MVCYTRNFEDVMLQRVFSDVAAGRFLDVGASTPITDSNTYALYRKGWRGVAIEPLPFQEMWARDRPLDVLLSAAAGAQPGRLTLQVFDEANQISSGNQQAVDLWRQHGYQPSRSIDVPVLTLDDVIETHLAGQPLHLVSIDVEGMEAAVLQGLDLRRHRPWVIVLEAVHPGTPWPAHQQWEGLLLEAGYLLCYFDGANRFYLAREQRHLLGHFALPPNVWDGFVPVRQLELEARVAQLEGQLKAARERKPVTGNLIQRADPS
jgi:FkbM family methyltransferase